MLVACGGQNNSTVPLQEVVEAQTAVGLDSPELDYATQLETIRELPGSKLCAAALPLQSISEMFLLNEDQTDISFFMGFVPEREDTDVVKMIANELNRRLNANANVCVAENDAKYREAIATCREEITKDPSWFRNGLHKLGEQCAAQARTQGLCEPSYFGGITLGGSSSIIGDCGCNKKAIVNVCGADFASRANILELINNNSVRKKRQKAKQEADEKRRERQRYIQNYSRSLNSTLYCTARQGLPGSVSISCF